VALWRILFEPNPKYVAKAFRSKADIEYLSAIVAIHQVDVFRQSEVYFGAKVRPDSVGWDVIPVRQKFFEHLVRSNSLA
jgi:hypothetical protein